MCGIVGYIGSFDALKILMDGLRRLEYRGYDSAGIAMIGCGNQKLHIARSQGKIANLEEKLDGLPLEGTVGIGHTRWATHGKPSDENAHPHRSGPFVVVHNGIIENYAEVKARLESKGMRFSSETDTEVIVRLVDHEWRINENSVDVVIRTLKQLRGSYAVVLLNEEEPEQLIAAKKESPLILGLSPDGCYLASDVPAILPYTRQVIYLEDGDVAVIDRSGYFIQTLDGQKVRRDPVIIDWNPVMAEKAGYKHFMLKEIYEQPRAIIDTFRSAVNLNNEDIILSDLNLSGDQVRSINKIFLVACGTSYHACMVGKYIIEEMCRIPVEVDLGSEFRYRNPILDADTLLLVISQSGETADTKAALQEGLEKGAICRAIVNVVGSSLARMTQGVIYTHAGPEIGVASTKAFVTQLMAIFLFSLYYAKVSGRMSTWDLGRHIQDLLELPGKIEHILNDDEKIRLWAKEYMHASDFLYLGRGILFPIALEGALKLKEISYIHAEGYAAGEMKHGPIALIDENLPVVVLMQKGPLLEKLISNVQEVKARGGQVLAFIEEDMSSMYDDASNFMVIPETSAWLSPILFTVPLQLLAYHIAVLRGTDVDQPRNLAKSVTVE